MKRYDCGDIRPEEWLDVMAFRHIETIHKQLSAESTDLALYVDLPKLDFPVVYGEMEYNLFSPFSLAGQQLNETAMTTAMGQAIHPSAVQRQAISTTDSSVANSNPFDSNIQRTSTHYALVLDADLQRDNPVEAKHRRLVRSHRNGPLDRDLKPNPKIRDELNVSPILWCHAVYLTLILFQSIMSYPPTQTLTPEEKDLVWKFRFYLTREKRVRQENRIMIECML